MSIKEFTSPVSAERFMVWWDLKGRSLDLVEFDRSKAIASLNSGEPVIRVWCDRIDQYLVGRLRR
ncbi:hypothetical protein QUA70_22820 [Microcoleus sp. LAD1_D5]|uniref:hypothetical protein n=1 Tax=unclassified Microcoleus TaxID=2642155 RepID=UPI002FD00D30